MKKLAYMSAAVAMSVAQASQASVALDPQAVNLEPFRFVPTLTTELKQDSNVYRLPSNEVSSSVLVVSPTFDLIAQDRDNAYSARYALRAGLYGEDISNYLDNLFNVNAHIEPTDRFRFDLGAGYNFLHDDLGTAFTEGYTEQQILARGSPDTYNLATIKGGLEYGAQDAAGQIALDVNFGQTRYDQEDAAKARDIDTLNSILEFRLRLMPKTRLLIDLERNKGSYSDSATATSSDYTETNYLLGVSWESTASTTGKIRFGNSKRELTNVGADRSKTTWDAGIVWTPLERARFTLDASQRFQDGTYPTVVIDSKNLALGWTHDWSDRWQSVLTAGLGKDDHTRVPAAGPREDDMHDYGFALNYQMRRWLILGAGARQKDRDSTDNTYDYDRLVYSLNAQLSL
ncbi:MAG TPA: outer membrane beta-barrel protein [Moraxellaceae bacterium]